MTHGERSTNREYTAPYVRLKGGQEMRFSGWNRHFKKTDPSIHRETIKLIARHHASNWRCSVPLRAVPRRAACFFFGAVLSLAWKNSSSEMLMTTTAAPTIFFQTATYLIVSSRRSQPATTRNNVSICMYILNTFLFSLLSRERNKVCL